MKRRRKREKKWGLTVTEEALRDFSRLRPIERLRWLDEARLFVSLTLSPRKLKRWEKFRNG